jgi:aspartyl-tRNA(Asn)/glutamyl-tRNA(Gln) amidotransferase subunit A
MVGICEKKVIGYLDKIKKENKKINAILILNPFVIEEARELDLKKKKGKLYGYVFGVKANICVKGLECNCASKTLEGWKSPYDASVIERIKKEDGLIIGILNMDEFACGSSGESSAFGACLNPNNLDKIPGGSSSGSAAAVAAGFCDVALGSDTGGSIRNPASFCGVIGVKPSYGLVSRYGLIDLSMSLDQIGVISKDLNDCALVLDIIKGKDERDATTFESNKIEFKKIEKAKIGILNIKGIDKKIEKEYSNWISKLSKNKFEIIELDLKSIDLAVQTYYLLVYAEFFSGTRKFDGRRFGLKIEDSCGKEVLRRISGGSEITKAEFEGAYYQKALKVKSLIKKEFEEAFKKCDAIFIPAIPVLPWKIGEKDKMSLEEVYSADALTIPANLAEICGISLPLCNIEGNPIGMQVLCKSNAESEMFSISKKILSLK